MQQTIQHIVSAQRQYFAAGNTRDWHFRQNRLLALRQKVIESSQLIVSALEQDLHKSEFEAYTTEIGILLTEIKDQLRLLPRMSHPQRVRPSLFTINGQSRLVYEPYGLTLIVSPWNYPFHLCMVPLVGAVAAGNTVVMKLSPDSPHTNAVVRSIVQSVFDPAHVCVVEGHRQVNEILFNQKWNHIFLTGSPALGQVAMAAAAQYLTPITLELGGKSPCIVDADADIEMAAKRIVFGKCINSGQTCIAPDYLMVHRSVREPLLAAMRRQVLKFFGTDPQQSPHYPRIVNDKAMERLIPYLQEGRVLMGGHYDRADRYIEFTVIDQLSPEAELLNREIFGPILPLLEFDHIDQVVEYLSTREKPLAFYYFTRSRKRARQLIAQTSSGGACINDTLMHIVNPHLPFGGVQNSGIGRYHGRYSYETFSHQRAVLTTSSQIDFWFKYPPFSDFWTRVVKRVMR